MNIQEFKSAAKVQVSLDEYKRIEYVYTFCPLFSEKNGKKEIAEFVKRFGRIGINSLYDATSQIAKNRLKDESIYEERSILNVYAYEAAGGDIEKYQSMIEHIDTCLKDKFFLLEANEAARGW